MTSAIPAIIACSVPTLTAAATSLESEVSLSKAIDTAVKAEKPDDVTSECVNNAEDVCSIKMVENSKLELNGLVKPKIKCEECDFITISTVKLKLHSRCVHAKQKDINEKFLRQKYDYTKHYWETGRIGISYQSFL